MRFVILIIFCTSYFSIFAQNFATQGEWEEYRARKIFSEIHPRQKFERFKGKLLILDEDGVQYDDIDVRLEGGNATVNSIFKQGIIYPSILPSPKPFRGYKNVPDSLPSSARHTLLFPLSHKLDTLIVTNILELKFPDSPPSIKRFSFWLFQTGFANPTEYFFELTNEKANANTDMQTFIDGSTLTLFVYGSVII
jgi:hypothetical protein